MSKIRFHNREMFRANFIKEAKSKASRSAPKPQSPAS